MADETQNNPNQSPFNSVEDVELYHNQIRARRMAKEAVSKIDDAVLHYNGEIKKALATVTDSQVKQRLEKDLAAANIHMQNHMPAGESFTARLEELQQAASAEKNDTTKINALALDMTERVASWKRHVGQTLQNYHQGLYDPRRNPQWR